jgi:hypothetical protein
MCMCILLPADFNMTTHHCEARFVRSYLFGHHKRPQEAQWWSAGQRVLVLAGRATSTTATLATMLATTPATTLASTPATTPPITPPTTVALAPRTPPAAASPAVALCAHPGRELRAFEGAARNLSAQLELPQALGDTMGDAVRRRFFEFKGTPRACARQR